MTAKRSTLTRRKMRCMLAQLHRLSPTKQEASSSNSSKRVVLQAVARRWRLCSSRRSPLMMTKRKMKRAVRRCQAPIIPLNTLDCR